MGPALQLLTQLLHHSDDELVENACWSFVHLSSDSDEHIDAVVNCNITSRVVQLLTHGKLQV